MACRWSEEITMKFVELYLQHECLWNTKSALYKNKNAKQSAYVGLEKGINIPGFGEKEIKMKIRSIRLVLNFLIILYINYKLSFIILSRATYSQEVKKIKDCKKSGAGAETMYIPKMRWFQLLDDSLRSITEALTDSESNLVITL
jgi:hypothetical protein